MRVVKRSVAAAEPGCAGNRGLNVISRALNRPLNPETLSEPGCDRRGEGAAGAMGVTGRDPRAFPDPDAAASGDEHIRNGRPGKMPAFDKRCSTAERKQTFAGSLHLRN